MQKYKSKFKNISFVRVAACLRSKPMVEFTVVPTIGLARVASVIFDFYIVVLHFAF
jgi:hypothetical protein